MTVAALVISASALLISLAAAWYAKRQADAAEDAVGRADHANAIALDANAIAEGANGLAERALSLAEEQASKHKAPWVLRHLKGDRYALTNDGDEPTFDVQIEVPDNSRIRGELQHDRIDAGSAVTILVALSMSSSTRDISVTYSRQPGGERLSWRGPLPAKP